MTNLLELTSEVQAKPNPAITEISEFKTLVEEADKPQRVLAYIYHMNAPDSAYRNYSPDVKEDKIKKDLFGDEDWEAPEYVEEAEEKYIKLNTTPEQKLLDKAIKSVYSLMDYLDEFDPTERDDSGKLVWKTKDYIRNMEKLGGVVDSLQDLRERVDKGEKSQGEVRGDVELTEFNK